MKYPLAAQDAHPRRVRALAGVAVRNAGKARAARVAKRLITTDWESLVRDPKIDVEMELMGGTTTARKVVAEAGGLGVGRRSGGRPHRGGEKAALQSTCGS